MRTLQIVYFAWVRERIGIPHENIEFEGGTVSDLVELLRNRGERYALAFSDLDAIRVAIDQTLSDFDSPLADATEVAFFPPMTGG